MAEDAKPIYVEMDGIKFISPHRYYDGDTPMTAHLLKENDKNAMEKVAKELSNLLPPFSVIVPIPNRCGYARETLELAKAVSRISGTPIADVLQGNERESQYSVKKKGRILSEQELGFRQTGRLPFYRKPVLLDNCCGTGQTAKSAYHALGNKGVVLTYAIDDPVLNNSMPFMKQSTLIHR